MGIFDKPKTAVTDHLNLCINKKDQDWALIISTCDAINTTDNGAKEAARVIRKKLKSTQSHPDIQLRVLLILKSLAENCGAKFHAEIASKKFLDELENVAQSPGTDLAVKQSLMTLLGDLSDFFRDEPSLYAISNLYNKLQGIHRTLSRTHMERGPQWNFSEAQISEDVELAKNNAQVLTQTLSFTDPEKEDITKNELIQEFYEKCKSLQQKIGAYLSDMQDEQLMSTLISVNNELLAAFKMYDDMIERGHVGIAKQESVQNSRHHHFDELLTSIGNDGAEGSGTSSFDPFDDSNEADYNPAASGPSAKAFGKMPATVFDDDIPTSTSYITNNTQYEDDQQTTPPTIQHQSPSSTTDKKSHRLTL